MKNKKIEYSIIAVSLVVMTSISVVNVIKDKKQERIEKEEKIQYQIMLNENSPSLDYEEMEKIYEQEKIDWEEKVRYEVVNNPNFEEDFNKLQEVERNYLNDINNKRGLENHTYAELDEIRRGYNDCLEKGLNEIELEEGSILNELRTLMILHHRWGNSDSYTKQCDLEEIIRYYL